MRDVTRRMLGRLSLSRAREVIYACAGKVDDEKPGSAPSCLRNAELKQQGPRQFPGLTAPDRSSFFILLVTRR